MQRRIAYICLMSLIIFKVNAEPDMDAMIGLEQEYLQDLPIVLSATRLAQPLSEAPVAMTVIDREMIEASGARTIPDILRLVPGFQVGYFDGNSPVASYHGHGEEKVRQMQVLVDGRSVYIPSQNAVHWSDLVLSIDDIERIEVTRGPNAATYGNNSFFAVVSITTKHAIESQGHYVRVRTGPNDTNDAVYKFGGQAGSLDYRVTLATTNDDGTDLLRDETEADSISYRLDYQATTNDRIMYQGGFKDIMLGDHESVPSEDRLTGHGIENTSAFQHIKWEHQISSGNSFSLQYYYNLNDSLEVSPPEHVDLTPLFPYDPFDFILELDIKSERHDLEFNQFLQPTENLRLVLGASARQDIVTANNFFDTTGTQKHELYRGFAHGEWQFRKDWLINAGYMIEDNDISGNDHSPRLALIHHINTNHTIRLGASKATRTPTLFEEAGQLIYSHPLTVGGVPVPPYDEVIFTRLLTPGNLDSEKITSFELGYIGEYLNKKMTVDIKIFKDKTEDLLTVNYVPVPTAAANQLELNNPLLGESGTVELVVNGLESTIYGTELAINYQFDNSLRIYGFYSHLVIESLDTNVGEDIENSAPEDSGGLMLIKHWPKNISSSIAFYRVENFDWLDRTNNRSADSYSKLDAKISKSWHFGAEKLQLSLIGQNLLDDIYDYNKTTYTSSIPPAIANPGSLQEKRVYFELSFSFN